MFVSTVAVSKTFGPKSNNKRGFLEEKKVLSFSPYFALIHLLEVIKHSNPLLLNKFTPFS